MQSIALPFLSFAAACEALTLGRTILFPTETFYGFGCDAMNPDSVGAVFSIKKRSLSMPLPVIIGSLDKLSSVVAHVPPLAEKLMAAFWPGPLSIVLPAAPEVPDLLTANAGRIAVRFSPHPATVELCRGTDKVLVASSANISGSPSATRPENLEPELVRNSAGIFAIGPEPAGGLPSTVVDVIEGRNTGRIRILRSGAVSFESLIDAGFSVSDASGAQAPAPQGMDKRISNTGSTG